MTSLMDRPAPEAVPTPAALGKAGPTWWPGLDGLRGLALCALLLYHHDASKVVGGFFSVSLFFTLSGFLITTLLVREHQARGRIELGAFWVRRLRRLMPVAFLGLALAAVVARYTARDGALPGIAGDIRAALLNVANWRFAFSEVTYADTISAPSPLKHYWSLAVEEQYYLIYPIIAIVALRRSRRAFAVALAGMTVFSIVAQLLVTSQNRAYLGTDTRLSELAIGGLAALGWAALRSRPSRSVLDVVGGAAAVVLLGAWATIKIDDPRLFQGILPLHAVLVAVLVVAAIHGDVVPKVTGARPFAWLGARSYGVYVFHFPLYLLLTPQRTGISGVSLLAVRAAAPVALAALVYRAIEQPFRRGLVLPRWQGPGVLVAGLATLLLVTVGLPNAGSPSTDVATSGFDLAAETRVTLPPLALPSTEATTAAAPTTADTTIPPVTAKGPPVATSAPVTTPAPTTVTTAAPRRPVRMLIVGESTAKATGAGIQLWGRQTGRAEVELVAANGCALQHDGLARLRDGWTEPATAACRNVISDAVNAANRSKPDVVVMFFGSGQLSDWVLPGRTEAEATFIGQPPFDQLYSTTATGVLRRLAGLGVPVLFTNTAIPNWDPTKTGIPIVPGMGPMKMNDAGRTRRINELTTSVVRGVSLAEMVPYAERISAPNGTVDPAIRPDGLHLRPEAVPAIMNGGLEADLRTAYQRAAARVNGSTRNGPTFWTP
jgi:peptidoglycan/LPS O-acetylase OafA/YrhL